MALTFFSKKRADLKASTKDVTDNLAGPNYYFDDNNKDLTRGLVIDLFHVPTKQTVTFKAFLTTYEDQYTSNWESTEVFGRMDPIQTFKNTKRVISLGWDVVASSWQEAVVNLDKCQRLFSMLYPVYEKWETNAPGSTTMIASPLFKLKFVNLIQSAGTSLNPEQLKEFENLIQEDISALPEIKAIGEQINFVTNELAKAERAAGASPLFKGALDLIHITEPFLIAANYALLNDESRQLYDHVKELREKAEVLYKKETKILENYVSTTEQTNRAAEKVGSFISIGNTTAAKRGLVGSISGFTYAPDIDVGFFSDGTGGELYPQTIKLACEYTVVHTHPLGWSREGATKRTLGHPYTANILK